MDVTYIRPKNTRDALAELAKWGEKGRILAGGTDLLVRMEQGVEEPEVIIDISAVDEWKHIQRRDGKIKIGSLVTYRDIEEDGNGLTNDACVLVEACRQIGSVQIRNRATIGGNLGNASPAADAVLALYVLDAEICLESVKGERWIPVSKFIIGPGKTVRKLDEVITAVAFSPMKDGERGFFQKIGQRRAVTISKVSAGGTVLMEGKTIKQCRLALGAVAPTVLRVQEVEAMLTGQPLDSDHITRAAAIAMQTCTPIDDIRSTVSYRRKLAGVLVRRGLESCQFSQ